MSLCDEVRAWSKSEYGAKRPPTKETLIQCKNEILEFIGADKHCGCYYTLFGKSNPFFNLIKRNKPEDNLILFKNCWGFKNAELVGGYIKILHKPIPTQDDINYPIYIYEHPLMDAIFGCAYDGKTECRISYRTNEYIRNEKVRDYVIKRLQEDGFICKLENHQKESRNHKLIILWG